MVCDRAIFISESNTPNTERILFLCHPGLRAGIQKRLIKIKIPGSRIKCGMTKQSPICFSHRFKKYCKYLRDNPEHHWFKAKWYGWGWVPATFEGWLVILAYLAFVIVTISHVRTEDMAMAGSGFPVFGSRIVPATIVLLVIIVWKGEKPGWHWGPPKK